MSKIGRVVQDIMEKFGGDVPPGYKLEDYFRDFWKDERRDKEEESRKINKEIDGRLDHDQQDQKEEV